MKLDMNFIILSLPFAFPKVQKVWIINDNNYNIITTISSSSPADYELRGAFKELNV